MRWNRELGIREHIRWLKGDMAVCLEGGIAMPDLCHYRLSKHHIYHHRAIILVTNLAIPNRNRQPSHLHPHITTPNLSGEWERWSLGKIPRVCRTNHPMLKLLPVSHLSIGTRALSTSIIESSTKLSPCCQTTRTGCVNGSANVPRHFEKHSWLRWTATCEHSQPRLYRQILGTRKL